MPFFDRRHTPPSNKPPLRPPGPGACQPLCPVPCPPICPGPCRDECPPPCPPPPPTCCEPCARPARSNAQIICCGREAQRCMPSRLAVSGLPCGLCEPLTLVGLEPACGQPSVCIAETCRGPSPAVAEVTVQMNAWVRDARGTTCCGCTEMVVCVRVPGTCLRGCGTFVASADVRLIDVNARACQPVFDVRLQVLVEVYMVRVEPQGRRRDCDFISPFPSQRPFYPQPWYGLSQ